MEFITGVLDCDASALFAAEDPPLSAGEIDPGMGRVALAV